VENRIGSVDELARKHRLNPEDLPAQLLALQTELARLETAETTVVALEQQLSALRKDYGRAAAALTGARHAAGTDLGQQVTSLMKVLGMPGGTFAIEVRPRDGGEPAPEGLDDVEFLVSANPGQPPKPVAKVASGGELSRISLAVQVAAATGSQGRLCMIFDEVDAGVGGGVAERVGRQLHALGTRGQVLCVTHLAQVASQADHHVRVAKLTDGKTSRTTLAALDVEERVEELARMLGGVELTQAAREHAREMLGAREREAAAAASKPPAKAKPPVKPLAAPRRGADSSRGGSAHKE
jgi:DNA repair protein RecN (Recombination protein N)